MALIHRNEKEAQAWFRFNLFDKVKVDRPLQCYTTFESLAKKWGLDNYKNGESIPQSADEWLVLNIGPHTQYQNEVVVAIENKAGDQYLISDLGLSLIEAASLSYPYRLNQFMEENSMMDPDKQLFETRTFILGNEAKTYSTDHLIKVIEEAEAEIYRLESIKTESTYITKKVKTLKDGLKKVVAELDSRK